LGCVTILLKYTGYAATKGNMTALVINWKGYGRKESQHSLEQYIGEAKESHTKSHPGACQTQSF
jgi:hypothetical protein